MVSLAFKDSLIQDPFSHRLRYRKRRTAYLSCRPGPPDPATDTHFSHSSLVSGKNAAAIRLYQAGRGSE